MNSEGLDIDSVFGEQNDIKIDDSLADKLGDALTALDANQQTLMMNEPVDLYAKLACGEPFSPYSYQKKAVKDFIYTFKRKGILSDQVGMGKTIEAGMILSELACRQQLKSLLILVPNLTMVYKWESELSKKFGIRNYYENVSFGRERIDQSSFPKIVTVNSKEDINVLLFDAMDLLDISEIDLFPKTNFNTLIQESFDRVCTKSFIDGEFAACEKDLGKITEFTLGGACFFKRIVMSLVQKICEDLKRNPSGWPRGLATPDYKKYLDWETEHPIDSESVYTLISNYYAAISDNDREGFYAKCMDKTLLRNSILSQFDFYKIEFGEKVKKGIREHLLKETNKTKRRILIASIAETIRSTFSVMIVGNEKKDGIFWMSETLFAYTDPAFQYLYGPDVGSDYTYFDLLIDMHFSTLIVDEVHNYIDVVSKNPSDYSKNSDACQQNNLFYLFEKESGSNEKDRYLVRRSCLYAKLLALANHAQQKMFMTATPIKSDMIDFYLLNLLRGSENKELDFSLDRIEKGKEPLLDYDTLSQNAADIRDMAIGKVRTLIDRGFAGDANGQRSTFENKLELLGLLEEDMFNHITCLDLICYVITEMRKQFFDSKRWEEFRSEYSRLVTPEVHARIEDLIRFRVNNYHNYKKWNDIIDLFEEKGNFIPEGILNCIKEVLTDEKIAEIVFDLVNEERASFEQNFRTKAPDGTYVPIKTIQSLVSSPDGLKQWRRKYGKLGIRTTRHQTNNLSPIWINLFKREAGEYYGPKKLPVWSRRNGKVINICRTDRFFDYVARVGMNNLVAVLQKGDKTKEKLKRSELLMNESSYRPKAEEQYRLWEENEKTMQKALRDLEEEYAEKTKDKTYRDKQQEAISRFKDPIAQYLYANVIDDGMAGICQQISFTQNGFPDFFASRMHMLIMMIQGGDDINKDLVLDQLQVNKVLVFSKDDKKLYDALVKEKQLAETADDETRSTYKNTYQHELFGWRNWILSNSIGDLKKGKNVLVVVPANKYEEGIDLQEATHLVNFDILHSPLAMEQRIGRIDRVRPKNKIGENDIYICAFTPLNDWSGFSTSFLAHHLHLFSRWNGDTTGIVSFPVSEKENLSTFDSIVNELEAAYKILSDHTEGEKVQEVYETIANTLTGYSGSSPEKVAACKKAIKSLTFKYVKDPSSPFSDGTIYSPYSTEKGENIDLEKHINRQATILSSKLSTIFENMVPTLFASDSEEQRNEKLRSIFNELRGDDTSLEYQDVSVLVHKSVIANDLRFLYYYHFLLDVASQNLDLYREGGGFSILDQKSTKDFLIRFKKNSSKNAATSLSNVINAYFSGKLMDPVTLEKEGGKISGVQGIEKMDVVDYIAAIDAKKANYKSDALYEAVINGNIGQTGSDGSSKITAGENSIFPLYCSILNKYFYHLLTIYVYLCRQVKNRLENMAEIIRDGAEADLVRMIDDNLDGFRKALNIKGGAR